MRTPVTMLDTDALRITGIRGDGRRMAVVFTGIGADMGAIARDEFVAMAQDGGNSVLFVTDKTRTWYSQTGMVARIVGLVLDYAARIGVEEIATLGNSMGGYGAILTSRALGAKTALALVPQFSVDASVIKETRWARLRAGLGPALAPSLGESFSPETRYLVVHGLHPQDAPQIALFPKGAHILHYLLGDGGHEVAGMLKQRGVLAAIVSAGLRGDMTAADQVLRRVGGCLRDEWTGKAA